MAELRICKECNEKKPLSNYYKSGKTTWRRKCKDCYNKRCKKTRQEKPDIHNLYCSRWREKNRERFNEYMRKYQKDNYDPLKKKRYNHKYYCGVNDIDFVT